MATSRPKYTSNHDYLDALLNQAWLLTDEEIDSIQPGKIEQAAGLIGDKDLSNHPFAKRTRDQIHNPHLHLLRVMRDPDFFPFTCKHLFGKPDKEGQLEILPMQHVVLKELWLRQFPMLIGSRGLGKSFTLALYILLRLTFVQGSKVVIVASAFRQAKVVFEYMERIWYSSPVFRDMVGGARGNRGRESGPRRDIDRCEFVVGDSVAMALPLGDGKKIRGLRANYVVAEEFASIPEEIYTTVVQGFGSVSADPVANVKDFARMRVLKCLGLWNDEMDEEEAKSSRGNQSILSGTAYYSFNHFCRYWKEYRAIIHSGGDKKKLEELMKGPPPEGFNWRSYSIIRIPFDMIPRGYMDASTVARAKQTTNTGVFLMEYAACFANDSEGFFKRSLIEKCVVGRHDNPNPPAYLSTGGTVNFKAVLRGAAGRRYVFGVDPASERDSFAVTVLEIWPDHRRTVFCWTTTKSGHREKLKRGVTKEHNFFAFVARKLRDLMKLFPCELLMVDSQGGGIQLREAFRDADKLQPGERPIYETIDPDPSPSKRKDTDDLPGEHILQMCNFRDPKFTSDANHGLKKDMEDQAILFPLFDTLAEGLSLEEDKEQGRIIMDGEEVVQLYDTLSDCMLEIEEMKNELASIIISTTPSGMEHWDTPDTKLPGMKKGPLRKDRYSSLLLANAGARALCRLAPQPEGPSAVGGFANQVGNPGGPRKPINPGTSLYRAPTWFQEGMGAKGHGVCLPRGNVTP